MPLLSRPCLLIALLCIATLRLSAQTNYIIGDPSVTYRLDSVASVFIDETKTLSFDNILSSEHQARFADTDGNLTFGYQDTNIWIRFNIKASDAGKEWLLNVPAPYLEYINFYQLVDGKWRKSESGYYRKKAPEAMYTGHVLPLVFSNENEALVYVMVSGNGPKTFPVFVSTKESLTRQSLAAHLGYGVFFGILIVMFCYNLFIYLALRNINFLLYIITIVMTFLIFASASGYGGLYLWPDFPQMNYYAGRISLPLQGIAVAVFTLSFLEVRKYSTVMYYIILSVIPLSILAGILIVTGLMYSAGNHLISIGTISYMTAGIVCRAKGNTAASYFIAAWSIYLVGGLLLTLRNSGLLPYNFFTTHFVEIGAAMETIIIAFALAERYRRLRIEKEEAQSLALKLQQETNEKLEIKVAERTTELSNLNENLRRTLETNRIQTKIIEDKNAELDSFFHRVSHDLKGPMASLRGLAHLAQLEVQDEVAKNYFNKQLQQIERIELIINGLINLTKLNQSNLESTPIDFHRLTDECIHAFQAHPRFAAIEFRKDIQEGLTFHSEWTLVNAILQNLVENAIKYSSDINPYVLIRILCEPEFVVIEVEDNGQGIPSEHQSRIFEMFYRATTNASGSGLGLYILKRSADRLNGTIQMKSEEKKGSTFTVRLPLYPK